MFHSCKCVAFPAIPTTGIPTLNCHSLFRLSESFLYFAVTELNSRYAEGQAGNRKLFYLRRHVSWPGLQSILNSLDGNFGWQIYQMKKHWTFSECYNKPKLKSFHCYLCGHTTCSTLLPDLLKEDLLYQRVMNMWLLFHSKDNWCFNLFTETKLPKVWRLYDIHLSINNIPVAINNIRLLSVTLFIIITIIIITVSDVPTQ